MHTEYWWLNLLEKVYLEDREGDMSMTLRWILGSIVMRVRCCLN
jgi:hypothetical protein